MRLGLSSHDMMKGLILSTIRYVVRLFVVVDAYERGGNLICTTRDVSTKACQKEAH